MEISGILNAGFFPHNRSRPEKDFALELAARENLTRGGEPRPGKSDLLLSSFLLSTRKVPTLMATGPLAAFRVADALRFLNKRVESPRSLASRALDQKSEIAKLKFSRLKDLQSSLRDLSATVKILRLNDALNVRSAKSSRPELVEAVAGKGSPVSTFSLTPIRRSTPNVLVSDQPSAPKASLGLSGSFVINGFKITVEAADSLFNIKNKINLGEDRNGNGVLDGPEDINGNGLADRFISSPGEFVPGIFVIEDQNGNGILEPTEDVNNNKRLDGGIADIRAVASIVDDRLTLTSLAGGRNTIDLQDDDGVLLSLGFFELNSKGRPVLKERQFDTSNPPVNLIRQPQTAEIDLTGRTITNDFNVFTEAVEDTALILKKSSDREARIRIFVDAANVANQIDSLVNRFNASIRKINSILTRSPGFQGDDEIQNIRNDLTLKPQERTRELNERNRTVEQVLRSRENRKAVGVTVENTLKNTVSEVSVTSVIKGLKSGTSGPFKRTGNDLLRRLTSIGIRSLDDDTFKVDRKKLNRALNVNTEEVLDLFNNPETGILPQLDEQLSRILREDLGDLDLKLGALAVEAQTPDVLTKIFPDIEENATIKNALQKLLAVV